ncbi:hypothetical protein AB3X52_15505 [Nocardioides sp. DS6]|uniref:Uncharacterized protein n=1 Tax=Nocardioides eburneus TaxID=3231482 RepID=A0ABV3T474_9ACTN
MPTGSGTGVRASSTARSRSSRPSVSGSARIEARLTSATTTLYAATNHRLRSLESSTSHAAISGVSPEARTPET